MGEKPGMGGKEETAWGVEKFWKASSDITILSCPFLLSSPPCPEAKDRRLIIPADRSRCPLSCFSPPHPLPRTMLGGPPAPRSVLLYDDRYGTPLSDSRGTYSPALTSTPNTATFPLSLSLPCRAGRDEIWVRVMAEGQRLGTACLGRVIEYRTKGGATESL